MKIVTEYSQLLRDSVASNRSAVDEILSRYHAKNPRLFGSVARGDATASSDVDLLVDLEPDHGNYLLRVAGIGEELSDLLRVSVDVVAQPLLRDRVSETALVDAVAL